MLKYILLCLITIVTGCSTQLPPIPQPAPIPQCGMKVNGECREMSASEKGGAVVRGHGDNSKEIHP